jgi:hypothetical protein
MKTCEKIIRRTGKLCGRKIHVVLYVGDYFGDDTIGVRYICPLHSWTYAPKGFPIDQTDIEEMIQRSIDIT